MRKRKRRRGGRDGDKGGGGVWQTYLTLPMLLFLSCSSRRDLSCSWARDISSSMLVISSLALRRFSCRGEVRRCRTQCKRCITSSTDRTKKRGANTAGHSHLSALPRLLDAVEHGSELGQPLALHRRHALHVLLRPRTDSKDVKHGNLDLPQAPQGRRRLLTLVVMTSSW